MSTQLIQLLDCEGDALALYAYNGNLMHESEATRLIDDAYGQALAILREANDGEVFGPGDVEDNAEEALATLGIERVFAEIHRSKHF